MAHWSCFVIENGDQKHWESAIQTLAKVLSFQSINLNLILNNSVEKSSMWAAPFPSEKLIVLEMEFPL